MPWGPSAIYRVAHINGWRIDEMRITDDVMHKARGGNENYRAKIAIAFRENVRKVSGSDPGWISYLFLTFEKLREVPSGPSDRRVERTT